MLCSNMAVSQPLRFPGGYLQNCLAGITEWQVNGRRDRRTARSLIIDPLLNGFRWCSRNPHLQALMFPQKSKKEVFAFNVG